MISCDSCIYKMWIDRLCLVVLYTILPLLLLVAPGIATAQFDGRCEDQTIEALANGANDVIVVRRYDGNLESTAWKAQIGKFHSLLESRQGKFVTVFVNNVPARV